MSEDREMLAEIHEKCLNLLSAASLPLPDRLHVDGMKGGIEEIMDMTEQAYREACNE